AVLLAEARGLYAAERELVVAVVNLVYPGHSGVDLLAGSVDQTGVVRPDRRTESVRRVVRSPDRIIEFGIARDWEDRTEDLLGGQPGGLPRLDDHSGLQEVALVIGTR